MSFKPMRHFKRFGALRANANIQRLQAFDEHPCVEGRQNQATVFHDGNKLFNHHLLGRAECARHHAALSIQIFGA